MIQIGLVCDETVCSSLGDNLGLGLIITGGFLKTVSIGLRNPSLLVLTVRVTPDLAF